MNAPPRDFFWPAAGSGLLLVAVFWSWLSRGFVYGEGHAERPILLFLASCGLAWLIFLLAVLRLESEGRAPLKLVLGVALAARVVLLPSNLILESDPYRYVLDGQMTLRGENPYLLSPAARSEAGAVAGLPPGGQAKRTISRISYPEIPTVYPPAAQVAFAAGAWLSGWDWRGQRWVFLAVDVAVMALLVVFLKAAGAGPGPVLLWAWNPLVLKEIANSAHLDVLVAAFLALSLLALLRGGAVGRLPWTALSGAALGLAAMSKIYPAILFPAFFLSLLRWRGAAAAAAFALAAGAVSLTLMAPFAIDGLEPMVSGLRVYAGEWRMNEGLFSLFQWALPHPRAAAALTAAALAVALPALRRTNTVSGLILQVQWILLAWFLLIPSPFPWYALPLAAMAALSPRTAPARATVVLSGAVFLYYLSFHIEYRGFDPAWWTAIRLLEHAAVWAAMLFFIRSGARDGARLGNSC